MLRSVCWRFFKRFADILEFKPGLFVCCHGHHRLLGSLTPNLMKRTFVSVGKRTNCRDAFLLITDYVDVEVADSNSKHQSVVCDPGYKTKNKLKTPPGCFSSGSTMKHHKHLRNWSKDYRVNRCSQRYKEDSNLKRQLFVCLDTSILAIGSLLMS